MSENDRTLSNALNSAILKTVGLDVSVDVTREAVAHDSAESNPGVNWIVRVQLPDREPEKVIFVIGEEYVGETSSTSPLAKQYPLALNPDVEDPFSSCVQSGAFDSLVKVYV